LAPLFCGAILGISSPLTAQTIWKGTGGTGGDGNWNTAAEWSAGIPSANTARFQVDGTYTSATAVVGVTSSPTTANGVEVGKGKTVTLNLSDTVALNAAGGNSRIGAIIGTGTGAANLTVSGPASGSASMDFSRFDVVVGSSLTFTGSHLSVTSSGDSSVGRATDATGNGNSMSILDGATFTSVSSGALAIGRDGSSSNNTVLVSGTGSTLSARGIAVGTAGANSGNSLKVQNGGKVTTTLAAAAGGTGTGANSNYYEATGAGSEIIFGNNFSLGDSAGTANTGGNYLRVASNAIVRTSSAMTVYSYNDSGANSGSNYIKVDAGGTLTSQSSITVNNKALLQLAATGAIEGRTTAGVPSPATISIQNGGRFEAAGSGLGASTTVTTTVASGGKFAVGLTGGTASTLTLVNTNSKVTLQTGSILEMGVFGAASNDQIAFSAANILTVQTGITFKLTLEGYTPVSGDSWNFITGSGFATGSDTNLASATFDLPTLSGGLSWDTSNFNSGGAWEIAVVPEPSIFTLVGGALVLLTLRRRRS